jgi:hypothetical protein
VQANAKAVATWAAAGKEVPQDVQRSADSLNALDKQLRDNIASLTRQRQTAIQQQLQGQKDAETLRRLTEKQDENTESIDTNVQSLLTATSESKTYEDTLQNRLKDIDAEYKITGDLNTRIEQTADAYRDAAIAAQRLGEVERAKELKALMQGQQGAPTVTPRVEAQQIAIPALNNKELQGTTQDLGDIAEGFRTAEEAAQSFGETVEQAIEQAAESMTINFSKMLGQTLATGKGMEGLGRMVLNTLADLAVQVGEIAIGVGISIKGIRKSLETLNPAVALIAGIALVALGTYAKTALQSAGGGSVPAFAQGGLTTGPMLAMVGDNQSGKEAIIPFERMGEFLQMAGAGQSNANVTVTGRLQGRDLVISNERTTFNRNRTKY